MSTDGTTTAAAPLAWIDASAGVAGDMLCGALLDLGVEVDVLQAGVDAVVPGATRLHAQTVSRAHQRAMQLTVQPLVDGPPHRTWASIRQLLDAADLPPAVTDAALRVFARLAVAEGHVHGVPVDDVTFHEVGALDSIADVVATCVGLHALGVQEVRAGPIAVGSGRVRAAHGELPVPVPAVLHLLRGWRAFAGGAGELATPTGAAIVTALATECGDLPTMNILAVGIGAGTRDIPDRPNVVRIVTGCRVRDRPPAPAVVLETNVDDLDPRLWPGVLARLLEAGASDAWLTPILMKKGRPAHTLSVLAPAHLAATLRTVVFTETSTIGLRESRVDKHAMDRSWLDVSLRAGSVRVKVAVEAGRIVHVTPEFDDVAALAARTGRPVRDVLEEAVAAVAARRLLPAQPAPDDGEAGADPTTRAGPTGQA